MIKEQSSKQSVFDFYLPFDGELNPENRWVKLADQIPWDELGAVYNRNMSQDMGAPAISSRVVIGALILKHLKKLPDEELIEDVRENPYYQYFLGFKDFQYRTIFVPSLFVAIRNRLGTEQLSEINDLFLGSVKQSDDEDEDKFQDPPPSNSDSNPSNQSTPTSKNKGMLLIDASVAPSDIKYPTDVDLLNEAREITEKIIDTLWQPDIEKTKPRTYRKTARKKYLAFTHNRKPGKSRVRKAVRQQLGYLRRNIVHINHLLDYHGSILYHVSEKEYLQFLIINELYRQQKEMFESNKHTIEHRIVSISQPHVRPIVRGKAGKKTEFGAKISAVIMDDDIYLDRLSWEAYHEGSDLIKACETYKKKFGYYPESINADKAYWNRENRKYVKEHGIKLYGAVPLGRRPVKDPLTAADRKKHNEESKKRNRIEAVFGVGKRKYGLGLVMAKTRKTSESWIATVIFVMNLAKHLRDLFFPFSLDYFCKNILHINQFLNHYSRYQIFAHTSL